MLSNMQQLKNILHFTGLTPNVPAQLPHKLQLSDGTKLVPDVLAPSIEGAIITANDTFVTVTVNATEIDVLCEAWHTIERSFGNTATKKLNPQPFILGGGVGDGGQFLPARTLFVAQSWAPGADPDVFFTTISAALAKAATMNPISTDQIDILVFAGIYVEDLTLVSSVNVTGIHGIFATEVNGNITYQPGVGVNAPQANDTEGVNWSFISTDNSANVWTFDTSAKPSGAGLLVITQSVLHNVAATGRAGPSDSDELIFFNCNFITGTYTFTNVDGVNPGVEIVGTRFRGFTLAGDTRCFVESGRQQINAASSINLTDTSRLFLQGLNLVNPMTVGPGCSLVASGCAFGTNATATLTVTGTGTADIRDTNYQSNARLISVGGGTINRTTWNDVFAGPTAIGANPVAFTVPYPDASYNVQLQLNAAGNAAGVFVPTVSKTGTGFTIQDPVGGNSFDYTVIQEG